MVLYAIIFIFAHSKISSFFHLENIQQSVLCFFFLNGRCRKCVLGLGNHFDLENSRKSLHLLPVLLVISFSPLYIFRAIGRTVFISEPTRPCSAHRCMKSDIHVYLHVYSRRAAFSTMFDHLSIWHATQSPILFTSQIYLCT
jgi:hypothetical protein